MPKKITATVGSEERIIVDRFQIDPANFTLSSLPDTSITSPVNGNFLSYYNNNWVNVDATTARTNLGLGSLATLNSLAFADLTDKPTTIAGYGITDALLVDGDFTTAGLMQTNGSGTYSIDASTYLTSVAFVDLTSTPTTIAGYGITDAFDGATSSLTGDIDLTSQVTGILPVANMAATALTTVQTAASQVAQLALVTEEGDVVVRSDELKTYMHNGGSAGTMADFTLLATPTDSVTSVDGSTGAVTTLQLGTSSTTALRGDTAIPDVSDFITASSTESLTNKTNLSILNNTKGSSLITTGADADFLFTQSLDENHADYVAPGNFSVLGVKSNASISTKNLSLTSGSTGTMTIRSGSNSVPMSIIGTGGINLSPAIGSVQILKQINHAADFSQANTNLFLYDTATSAVNSGSSIVFGAKYDSTTYATFLSEGPYIASYKVNATDNDYSFGLKFATIKNGATSQAVAMTIDEDQNVGINGTLDVNSDTLRLTETSASLPYPDTGLVPAIELYRNVGSPVGIHNIGHLRFYGNTDTNVKTEYGSINVEVRDSDSYALSSKMHFDVIDTDDDTSAPILTRAMTLSKGGVIASVPFTAYDAITLSSTSDDENAGPTLFLYRNSPSVADSDVLGRIEFQGRKIINDGTLSQGGAETYAHIQAKVTDKTFESEDGELILSTMTAGADTEVLTLSGVGSTFNNQLSVTGDVNIVGSGYSSDLTSSIKPDNTNSSSSWKLTDKVLNINSASSAPTAMWLGDSGTKLYIIGSTNDDIDRFELTTPYDISSNIIATTSNDDGNGSVPQGMYFKSDGTRYWTVDSGPDYIRQYSLSTAWDIQTSSRSTNTLNAKAYVNIRHNGDANPTGVAFSADGLKVIICGTNGAGATGDSIYSYTLGTAFDIFTMVGMDGNNVAPSPDVRVQFSSFTDLRDEISLPHDIFFLPDGLTLYVVCRDRDDIVTFTLGTAFDITTMTYNGHLSIDDIDGTVGALYVDPVNNIGLMIGQESDNVYQWTVDNNALIVDAQSTQFKGQLGVYDDLTVDGDVKISGKSFYKGALISSSTTTTFGNTILGNATGVYTRIGHTSGVGTLDLGRSIKSQIINLHGGVTESGETKTLNIGTGGASGSTTNITIGTATAGATQTTTVNGTFIVNNDFMELVSTTDDATEKPVISLYRNGGAAGPNDELGSVRFYGNDAGGEKSFFGGMYCEATGVADAQERGTIKFHVADGSVSDDAITDVTPDISGDLDTVLEIDALGVRASVPIKVSDVAVSIDGVNQTAYRTGEIIEVITGYADGSTISGQATTAGVARDFALEDVTALQSLTTSYGKINGTLVNYLPPVGTKTLEIEYGIFVGYESPDTGIMHHKLNVGGTYVTNTRMTHRDDSALNKYVILKSILTVDGSGDVAAGNVDSWNSAIALQLDGREYGGSAEIKLHITHYYDGSSDAGNQIVVPPSVKITAIG